MAGTAFTDVASGPFWLFVALAVATLSLAARGGAYTLCLAVLNLCYAMLVAGAGAGLALFAAIACLHWACRLQDRPARLAGIVAFSVLLGALFLSHKLPTAPSAPDTMLRETLRAIGFSYILLRAVEYLRAAANDGTRTLRLSDTINFLIPFHMLLAGPVMAFGDFERTRLARAPLDADAVLGACERIARGLFKKFVLANGLIQNVFLTEFTSGGAYFLLEVQLYYLFIYLDFSAYTDIAVGIGRLIGVSTPENFDRPLGARNIIAFWERWHMSLSQFIRRNLFIPIQLAGMRRTHGHSPRLVASVAFGVAFLLCGMWHGLSWRFVLWGIGHALALVSCNYYKDWLQRRLGRQGAKAFSERPLVRVAATVLTFEFVAFSLAFLVHPGLAFLG